MKQTCPTSFLPRSSILACILLAVALSLLMLSAASAGTWKRITIDGSFTDWAGVPVAAVDDENDTIYGWDLKEIYTANDDKYLYFMVKIYPSSTNADYTLNHHHFYIDGDNDPATGRNGFEMCVEDPWGGFSQRYNDGWSDGGVTGLDQLQAPYGPVPTFQYEYRISLAVRDIQPADVPKGSGNPARDLPVFTQPTIRIGWEVLSSGWGLADTAPNFTYDIETNPPPVFTGTTNLVGLTSTTWRVNDSGTDLGADWLVTGYNDTQLGWKGGPGLLGFNAPTGVYPAPVATTLTSGHPTYYFVSHFPWSSDQNGAGLLVSNFLSAGAVFYLNGAEVKRVRMPSGTVTYTTPATGGPAQPGLPEFFDLPVTAFVVGDNVLQVEVHQAAGAATSLAFGLGLVASDNFAPRIVDTSLPADRTVREGDATTFDPGAVAGTGPFTYQWSKDGQPIANATNATVTLNPVVNTNAGSSSVEITGPKGLKVTSRAAVLTTTAEAVAITNPNLPADQTVAEGMSATFTVAATGTLLTYQWYKGNDPLTNEIGAQLTLNNVALTDSGTQYGVNVTNRLGGLPSRKATLTVASDLTPPGITSAVGAGRKVVVTFSEALDPVSSQLAASYRLDGGVQVQGAVLDPVSGRAVTLTTAQQAFGQVYTLSVTGVKDRFGNASNASTVFRSTILIDGDLADWSGIPVIFSKDQVNPAIIEYHDISVTNDTDYLYVRFSFHSEAGPLWDWSAAGNYWQVAFDMDNDPATGFFSGAEAVDEMNSPFRLGPNWGDGYYNDADTALAPANVMGTNFEIRVSLRATHEADHSLLFPMAATNGTIGVFCRLISTGWSQVDITAPGAPYTFATFPPLPTAVTITVNRVGNKIELTWPGGGGLETRASMSTGTWNEVTGATSGVRIDTTTVPAGYYRVRQ